MAGRGSSSVLVAAAALVDDLERPRMLLAGRRSAPADLRGQWELPGGKVERGERPEDAVCRELREELGVGVELGEAAPGPGPEPPGSWPLGPGLMMCVWWARITGGQAAPLADHDALRWLNRAELGTVPWLASNAAITVYLHRKMHH